MVRGLTNPMIVIVTDCGGSDRARYEIAAARCFYPLSPVVSFFETSSMNTLHAGFTAAAHALSTIEHFGPLQPGERIGAIVNAAPREGQNNGRALRGRSRKVTGEEVYALLLKNRVWVVGPNAGMNLYFIDRKRIRKSFLLSGQGLATPFRSKEFMVPALAKLLEVRDFPQVHLTPKALHVPVPEQGIFVADWDRHGNIYLFSNISEEIWFPRLGRKVTVRIGDVQARLRRVSGIFAGRTAEPTLTTGSLRLNGRLVHYIVVVGGDAHRLFKNPPVGTRVFVEQE